MTMAPLGPSPASRMNFGGAPSASSVLAKTADTAPMSSVLAKTVDTTVVPTPEPTMSSAVQDMPDVVSVDDEVEDDDEQEVVITPVKPTISGAPLAGTSMPAGMVSPVMPSASRQVLHKQHNPSSMSLLPADDKSLQASKFAYYDMTSVIRNASAENKLSDLGYIPLSRVVTTDRRVSMFKARDENGIVVFVLVDDDNLFSVAHGSDLSMNVEGHARAVPESMKTGLRMAVGPHACGVALVCEDGICTVSRNPETCDFDEATFQVQAPENNEAAGVMKFEDQSVAYPIVRLSAIEAAALGETVMDRTAVLKDTYMVNARLRQAENERVLARIDRCMQHAQTLIKQLEQVKANHRRIGTATKQASSEWGSANVGYLLNRPTEGSAEQMEHILLQKSIARNEDHIVQLLTTFNRLASIDLMTMLAMNEGRVLNEVLDDFQHVGVKYNSLTEDDDE